MGRHVAPLGEIILIPDPTSLFFLFNAACSISGEATHTNFRL